MFGERLDHVERELFVEVAERNPPTRPVKEAWFLIGRRAGKDSTASAIAVTMAMNDYKQYLRPGEIATIACLAVSKQQARIVLSYIRASFLENPLLAPRVARETENGLELTNNIEILVLANNFRSIRGRTILCAIFDECLTAGTMIETAIGPVPIEEIRPGDRVWTRQGLRPVVKARMTNPRAAVHQVTFRDGRTLTGTANHPVFVCGKGFVPLSKLHPADVVETWNSSNGAGGVGISPRMDTTRTAKASSFIARSIGRRMAPLPIMCRSITTMATNAISRSLTFVRSRLRSIVTSMVSECFASSLPSGTAVASAPCGPPVNPGSGSASFAGRRSGRPVCARNTATGIVEPQPCGAATIPISVCTVRALAEPVPVYNLEVDGVPEYFANGVLVHNCAYWRDLDTGSAYPDVETYAAVIPAMVTLPNAMLIGITTVYRKAGLAYDKFRNHFGKDDPDILVIKAPTRAFNPLIPQRFIDQQLDLDPEVNAAEYLSEFRADLADYVDRAVVEAAVDPGVRERPYSHGCKYTAFVDPSGGSGDAMTLAIAHRQPDGTAILDCLREVRPPFSPESVVADFAHTLAIYKISRVIGDHYGGEFVREPLRKQNIAYQLADKSKSDLYRDALPLLNSGKVRLLDHPRLVSQLCSLERRTGRGTGRDSIDHPVGLHDDIANAVCGALVTAEAKRPLYVHPDVLARSARPVYNPWTLR
jgi:hypothetical protein